MPGFGKAQLSDSGTYSSTHGPSSRSRSEFIELRDSQPGYSSRVQVENQAQPNSEKLESEPDVNPPDRMAIRQTHDVIVSSTPRM